MIPKHLIPALLLASLGANSFGQTSPYFIPLPSFPDVNHASIPNAISEDGTSVVGAMGSAGYGGSDAFIWQRNIGVTSLYNSDHVFNNFEAHGVSGDGAIVVGRLFTSTERIHLDEVRRYSPNGRVWWTGWELRFIRDLRRRFDRRWRDRKIQWPGSISMDAGGRLYMARCTSGRSLS